MRLPLKGAFTAERLIDFERPAILPPVWGGVNETMSYKSVIHPDSSAFFHSLDPITFIRGGLQAAWF
jgi:hypothetical protein